MCHICLGWMKFKQLNLIPTKWLHTFQLPLQHHNVGKPCMPWIFELTVTLQRKFMYSVLDIIFGIMNRYILLYKYISFLIFFGMYYHRSLQLMHHTQENCLIPSSLCNAGNNSNSYVDSIDTCTKRSWSSFWVAVWWHLPWSHCLCPLQWCRERRHPQSDSSNRTPSPANTSTWHKREQNRGKQCARLARRGSCNSWAILTWFPEAWTCKPNSIENICYYNNNNNKTPEGIPVPSSSEHPTAE